MLLFIPAARCCRSKHEERAHTADKKPTWSSFSLLKFLKFNWCPPVEQSNVPKLPKLNVSDPLIGVCEFTVSTVTNLTAFILELYVCSFSFHSFSGSRPVSDCRSTRRKNRPAVHAKCHCTSCHHVPVTNNQNRHGPRLKSPLLLGSNNRWETSLSFC